MSLKRFCLLRESRDSFKKILALSFWVKREMIIKIPLLKGEEGGSLINLIFIISFAIAQEDSLLCAISFTSFRKTGYLSFWVKREMIIKIPLLKGEEGGSLINLIFIISFAIAQEDRLALCYLLHFVQEDKSVQKDRFASPQEDKLIHFSSGGQLALWYLLRLCLLFCS